MDIDQTQTTRPLPLPASPRPGTGYASNAEAAPHHCLDRFGALLNRNAQTEDYQRRIAARIMGEPTEAGPLGKHDASMMSVSMMLDTLEQQVLNRETLNDRLANYL